ncbi:MAG: PD-(D/E)XK nuclease family protein [Candidatus Zapsychrus exili]|nr:PD-(D/E)XK nuclease family protein [Candidatus Zapsychrus exili]
MQKKYGLLSNNKDDSDDSETNLAVATPKECPYCKSKKITKSGLRKNKYIDVQLYECRDCQKRFTPVITKYRSYPLQVIITALTLYNEFYSFNEIAKAVSAEFGINISDKNIKNWLKDFKEYLPFLRMREFAKDKFNPKEAIERVHMFHGQIYDYQYHRAKLQMILEEDFRNNKFKPLREFLDLVSAECPHQVFKESSQRASEFKNIFNMDQVRITPKAGNIACRSAGFVLQAVSNNKKRHETLQRFMLANDSVTVAVEVPVLLDSDDLRHFRDRLGFDVPPKLNDKEVITGHIDLLQIRNGCVHILDYKPSAKKVKPIEQLTLYALALSRLTTLRLFHFKCTWFDKEDYFEFFPLHVVYKKRKKKRPEKMRGLPAPDVGIRLA